MSWATEEVLGHRIPFGSAEQTEEKVVLCVGLERCESLTETSISWIATKIQFYFDDEKGTIQQGAD